VTAWSQETLTLLAHTVHYALVAGGLIGLGWLLVPQLVTPHGSRAARHVADAAPRDPFEARVAALRTAAAHGRLATLEPPAPVAPAPASTSAHETGVATKGLSRPRRE